MNPEGKPPFWRGCFLKWRETETNYLEQLSFAFGVLLVGFGLLGDALNYGYVSLWLLLGFLLLGFNAAYRRIP